MCSVAVAVCGAAAVDDEDDDGENLFSPSLPARFLPLMSQAWKKHTTKRTLQMHM